MGEHQLQEIPPALLQILRLVDHQSVPAAIGQAVQRKERQVGQEVEPARQLRQRQVGLPRQRPAEPVEGHHLQSRQVPELALEAIPERPVEADEADPPPLGEQPPGGLAGEHRLPGTGAA